MTSPYVQGLRAPNPGPMTLEGTNTWLIGNGSRGPVLVVDPGPLAPAHQDSVLRAAYRGVVSVVLTHRHLDHSDSAAELARRAECGVRAADPALVVGSEGLAEGDRLEVAGATLTAVATAGHTSDSMSLLLTGDDGVVRLLSGDMVLGRGTTVITYPDGDLGAYLDSLARLRSLVAEHGIVEILPGHGPVVTDPAGWLAYYAEHRQQRLNQVRAALASGARAPAEVVAAVYADVDQQLWPAAEQSVRAQLEYLDSGDSDSTHR